MECGPPTSPDAAPDGLTNDFTQSDYKECSARIDTVITV
jgi:hypothetical protein